MFHVFIIYYSLKIHLVGNIYIYIYIYIRTYIHIILYYTFFDAFRVSLSRNQEETEGLYTKYKCTFSLEITTHASLHILDIVVLDRD
jgi:hypothetical protein